MQHLLAQLESVDACSLTVVVIALFYVGNAVSGNHSRGPEIGAKCGIGLFLIWMGYWLVQYGMSDLLIVMGGLIRGLLFGAFLFGILCIIIPCGEWLYSRVIQKPHLQRQRKKQEKLRLQEQKQAEQDRIRREQREQEAWRRQAPERERLAIEAEKQRRKEDKEQQRRIDARAEALRSFNKQSYLIGERFSRALFDEYLKTYMNDSFSAKDVERRGNELIELLEYHANAVDPHSEMNTLEELSSWFQEQSLQIEQLHLDDRLKRTLLAKLKIRYVEMTELMLEDLTP